MPHLNKFVGAFKAFAHLHDHGWIRSIRVSNFKPEQHSRRRWRPDARAGVDSVADSAG
jgi:diketogulonate reductase-like aldo/keto reductase